MGIHIDARVRIRIDALMAINARPWPYTPRQQLWRQAWQQCVQLECLQVAKALHVAKYLSAYLLPLYLSAYSCSAYVKLHS
jgi:hypothetical protein